MGNGIVQVPPDSTGQKVDGASLDVGANTVIRQRIVIGDNSASAQFATVTNGALSVAGTFNVSGTPSVVLAAGTGNIGTVNDISRTVSVVIAAGAANIGTVNNISKTVDVAVVAFKDASGNTIQVVDSANIALRVIGAGTLGSIPIGNFIDASGQSRNLVDSANLSMRVSMVNATATATVVLAAGTANFGTLNNISRTVQVQLSTPFTVNDISKTVSVILASGAVVSLTGTATMLVGGFLDPSGDQRNVVDSANLALRISIINASATVTVTTAAPWITNVQSVSHGPKCLQLSTSATAALVTAPGAGNFVNITMLACTNLGTVTTVARIGSSASPDTIQMVMLSAGGGFVMNFDPPWKVFSNEAVNCRVKPNSSGNCYFNINYFVSTS